MWNLNRNWNCQKTWRYPGRKKAPSRSCANWVRRFSRSSLATIAQNENSRNDSFWHSMIWMILAVWLGPSRYATGRAGVSHGAKAKLVPDICDTVLVVFYSIHVVVWLYNIKIYLILCIVIVIIVVLEFFILLGSIIWLWYGVAWLLRQIYFRRGDLPLGQIWKHET